MIRTFALGLSAALIVASSAGPASAAACRDGKGKFIKCAKTAPVQCKDAKGRFAKCGTAGATPA